MDQREVNQVADFIWAAVEKQVRAAIAVESRPQSSWKEPGNE